MKIIIILMHYMFFMQQNIAPMIEEAPRKYNYKTPPQSKTTKKTWDVM